MKQNIQDVLEILGVYNNKGEKLKEYTVQEDINEQGVKIYKEIAAEDQNKIEGKDCILYFAGKTDEQTNLFSTTGGLSYITIQEMEKRKYKIVRKGKESIIDKKQQQINIEDIEKWTQEIDNEVLKRVANQILGEGSKDIEADKEGIRA